MLVGARRNVGQWRHLGWSARRNTARSERVSRWDVGAHAHLPVPTPASTAGRGSSFTQAMSTPSPSSLTDSACPSPRSSARPSAWSSPGSSRTVSSAGRCCYGEPQPSGCSPTHPAPRGYFPTGGGDRRRIRPDQRRASPAVEVSPEEKGRLMSGDQDASRGGTRLPSQNHGVGAPGRRPRPGAL